MALLKAKVEALKNCIEKDDKIVGAKYFCRVLVD